MTMHKGEMRIKAFEIWRDSKFEIKLKAIAD